MIKKNLQAFDRRFLDPALVSNEQDTLLENCDVRRVLQRLFDANNSAVAFGRDPWDFAVELPQLSEFGVGTHTLRTMICRQWITHMREVPNSDLYRAFEPESDLVLSSRSCFVLTRKGFEIATELSESRARYMTDPEFSSNSGDQPSIQHLRRQSFEPKQSRNHPQTMPCWDQERRELRIGEIVVKRFKWPAKNQEQVLDAFQEEGWPTHIDDPLVPDPQICPKRRLHDTLKCLNRKQIVDAIKFRGDGTGQGVLLEINWDEIRKP